MSDSLPGIADTVVIGGGTAGAAITGELAARSDQSVLLLEAGPDYGSFEAGRWPADLTDARAIPTSHDWGYTSGSQYGRRVIKFDRARVMGGCSSHNGCAAIWGSRLDYDHWAELGNPGWSTEDLLALFRTGSERLRVRIPPRDEITPYQLAWLEAARKPESHWSPISTIWTRTSVWHHRRRMSPMAFAGTRPLPISIRSVTATI